MGAALLAAYGTSLNLAPVEFASVTGIYVTMLFVMFQVVNVVFFKTWPQGSTLVGGALIVAGGIIVYASRRPTPPRRRIRTATLLRSSLPSFSV